jgi:hypothetical protein
LTAAARAGRLSSSSGGAYDVIVGGDGKPALRRVVDPENAAAVYNEAMRCDAVLDLTDALLGKRGVRFDHGKLNFKPPGGGGELGWHQDFAFYPHTNDDMLAVGVMIEDCFDDNGPLLAIPGSHKKAVFNHHRNGRFVGLIDDADLGALAKSAIALTGKAGAISIHHARTIHASGANRGKRPRPLLLFNYFAADAYPIFYGGDWDAFNARLLRGKPVFTPRIKNIPCKTPHPAPKPQIAHHTTISIYDLQKTQRVKKNEKKRLTLRRARV